MDWNVCLLTAKNEQVSLNASLNDNSELIAKKEES